MLSAKMIKLMAVVLHKDVDNVSRVLLDAGVMHLETVIPEQNERNEGLRANDINSYARDIGELRQRIEGLAVPFGILFDLPLTADLEDRNSIDIEKENAFLDAINVELQGFREQQRLAQQEIMKLQELKRHFDIYGQGNARTISSSPHTFLTIRAGTLPAANVAKMTEALGAFTAVAIPTGGNREQAGWLLVAMKRDSSRIDEVLESVGWLPFEPGERLQKLSADATKDLMGQIATLQQKQQGLGRDMAQVVKKHETELKKIWIRLKVKELFCTVQSYFLRSARTVIFSGWLPVSKRQPLEHQIRAASRGRCYMEWLIPHVAGPQAVNFGSVPVKLRNPRFLAPFQMLVANFGIPEYGTIDPTPYVTIMYLIMFGMMFADAGHGIVLALSGALGLRFMRRASKNIRNILALLIWCGGSSVVFGVLFGSYFGVELRKPLWFDYNGLVAGRVDPASSVGSILDVLAITVYFGITVILLGLLFNWINLIARRRWEDLMFDKGGILGAWMYVGGIYASVVMVRSGYRDLPDTASLNLLVGLPALLLLGKGVCHFAVCRRRNPSIHFKAMTPVHIIMEWGVELLEIFSGYLSNTLSFMRVAGLGIAHVSLMIVVFELERMARGQGRFNIFSLLILLAGNIFVIGLEGLSAGIQALRLNYYEFFTKFFHGTGKLYSPISLRSR